MRELIAVYPSIVVNLTTEAELEVLAAEAPLDGLMRFALRHVRCVVGRPDALEIDPLVAGERRGRCAHCGAEESLPMSETLTDNPLRWWAVLMSATCSRSRMADFVRTCSGGAGRRSRRQSAGA